MTVLGIDSAGKTAGVAVVRDGTLLYECCLAAGLTHSETLLGLCDDAFRATGLAPADVDLYAVAAGPGSFTGLRIGLATVKGLAFAQSTPCAPVSTLEALAYSQLIEGTVLCALDARRGEVYYASFAVHGGAVHRLCPDQSGPAACLGPLLDTLPGTVYLVGDGAHLVAAAWPALNRLHLCLPHQRQLRAGGVCRAALAGDVRMNPEQLTPQYHRLSQAERERAQRLAAQEQATPAP